MNRFDFESVKNEEEVEDSSNNSSTEPSLPFLQRSFIFKVFPCRNLKLRCFSCFLLFFLLILLIMIVYFSVFFKEAASSPYFKNSPTLISKPFNDNRSFYTYKLENGVQTLLIVDKDCNSPGSAVSIRAGSKQEDVVQGLAHLLEHVLFMGSKNYPQEEYFYSLITKLGGDSNAFTVNDATVFYWSIKPSSEIEQQFDLLMDIWSDFFLNPLILEEKVAREINAVDSEFIGYLNMPETQLDFLFKLMMNPESPNAGFAYGNLDSFNVEGVNLTSELQKFYETHYVADQISLVLLGNFTIDQLQTKAERMLDPLKNSRYQEKDRAITPDSGGYWRGKLAKFRLVQGKFMVLSWVLPEMFSNYKINALEYWCDLLNSEHEKGLIWTLKLMGLIEGFSASAYSYELGLTFFNVKFKLNNNGFNNLEVILSFFHAYLKKIKVGINTERWEKMKRVRELAYDYGNQMDGKNDLSNIAYHLSLIPENSINDIFKFIGSVFEEYSQPEISKIEEYLALERCLIVLGSSEYATGDVFVEDENKIKNLSYFQDFTLRNYSKMYSMGYDFSEITQVAIDEIKISAMQIEGDLELPEDNRYIPTNLFMPCKKPYECENDEVMLDAENKPYLISEENNHHVWYTMQRSFNKLDPKASIHLQIISPLTFGSPNAVFLGHLIRKWLKWHFKPLFSQLLALGYEISFGYKPNFELKIRGFSNKMELIARDLGQIIKNCTDSEYISRSERIFGIVKNITVAKLKNKMLKSPLKQAIKHLEVLLSANKMNYSESIQTEISNRDFAKFMKNFTNANFINLFIFGAISQDQALKVWNNLSADELNSVSPPSLPIYQTLKLNIGLNRFITINNNPQDNNTGLLCYYDLGVARLETLAKFMTFYEFFSGKAFDFLRTKAQLGYQAGVKAINLNGVFGFVIYVQGKTENVSFFEQKIEEFLDSFLESLDQDLKETDFLMMREAKLSTLKNTKMEEQEKQFWGIINGNLTKNWGIIDEMATELKKLDFDACKEFWKSIIKKKNEFGRLNLAVVPESLKEVYHENLQTYEDFKEAHEIYEDINEKLGLFLFE